MRQLLPKHTSRKVDYVGSKLGFNSPFGALFSRFERDLRQHLPPKLECYLTFWNDPIRLIRSSNSSRETRALFFTFAR